MSHEERLVPIVVGKYCPQCGVGVSDCIYRYGDHARVHVDAVVELEYDTKVLVDLSGGSMFPDDVFPYPATSDTHEGCVLQPFRQNHKKTTHITAYEYVYPEDLYWDTGSERKPHPLAGTRKAILNLKRAGTLLERTSLLFQTGQGVWRFGLIQQGYRNYKIVKKQRQRASAKEAYKRRKYSRFPTIYDWLVGDPY